MTLPLWSVTYTDDAGTQHRTQVRSLDAEAAKAYVARCTHTARTVDTAELVEGV